MSDLTPMPSPRRPAPRLLATALALVVMASDGVLSRSEGMLLMGAAVAYTLALVHLDGFLADAEPGVAGELNDVVAFERPERHH